MPGARLHVLQMGAGPPLILLHGWTLDHRQWQPQWPMASHARLIMPDRRGFGRSSGPPRLADEPDDVLALADALGLARFHLAGLSQGGKVALAVAARAPGRLLSLSLIGSAADVDDVPDDEAIPLAAMRQAARAGDLAAMRALWAAHPLTEVQQPAARPLLAAMLADYGGADLLAPASRLAVGPAALAGLEVPVCVMVGASDTPWRRAVAARLAAAAPRGALHVIAGAGHLASMDQPGRCNALLAAMMAA